MQSLERITGAVAGLRTFNAKFIAAISVVYMTAGCNNNIVSLILPLVESEYGVTSAQSYLLVSINQLGLLVGTLFSAKLPGSRKTKIVNSIRLSIAVYALLLFKLPLGLICLIRLLAAIFLGFCLNEVPSLITQVSAPAYRGFNFGIAFFMWPIGGVLPTFAYQLGDSMAVINLSYLIFGSAALALLAVLVPDSPRQLFLSGDYEAGREAVEAIYRIGGVAGGPTNDQHLEMIIEAKLLAKAQLGQAQQLGALFRPQYQSITISLVSQFTFIFCLYYYIAYCMPSILNIVYSGQKQRAANLLLVLLFAQSAAYLASAYMMQSSMGRKKSLLLAYIGASVSCLFINWGFAFWVVSVKFWVGIIITVIYPFMTEMYKTSLRSSITALCYAAAQLFGSAMIAGFGRWKPDPGTPFIVFGLGILAAAVALQKMPQDRAGKPLTEDMQEL